MRQKLIAFAGLVILILFGYFIWPTPYRYFVLPSAGSSYLVRLNRLTGRMWVLRDLSWYSPAERNEVALREGEEIKRRCQKATESGAFSDSRNQRIIELKGYTFSCP